MKKSLGTVLSLFVVVSILLLTGCKAKKIVNSKESIAVISGSKIKKRTRSENAVFETFKTNVKTKIVNNSKKNTLSLNLQMAKGKYIWINGTYFGFTIFRMLVTPESVNAYVKPSKQYIKEPYKRLGELLGADIDFEELQGLLVGNLTKTIKKIPFKSDVVAQNYLLSYDSKSRNLLVKLLVDPFLFKIKETSLNQTNSGQIFKINYDEFRKTSNGSVPHQIKISVKNNSSTSLFSLSYSQIKFDEKINAPFQIPKGYNQISLENLMP